MKILSFDTSNSLASVAIIDNGKILSNHITKQSSQQAEQEQKQTQEVKVKLKLSDMNLVSITNGPGSFTGVRIALAAALGLQTASQVEFIALTNFQVLGWHAKQIHPNKPIAVVLDARREQVYLQLFNKDLENISEPMLISKEELPTYISSDMALIGDGVDSELNLIANAEILAKASEFYWRNKSYHDLIPLYIRQPDVAEPKV